jgi:hypothetical protein
MRIINVKSDAYLRNNLHVQLDQFAVLDQIKGEMNQGKLANNSTTRPSRFSIVLSSNY